MLLASSIHLGSHSTPVPPTWRLSVITRTRIPADSPTPSPSGKDQQIGLDLLDLLDQEKSWKIQVFKKSLCSNEKSHVMWIAWNAWRNPSTPQAGRRFATPKDATLRGVRREHLTPKPLVCLLIPSGNMAHLFMDSFSIAETNRG